MIAGGSLGLGESYMDGWWMSAIWTDSSTGCWPAKLDDASRSWRDAIAWLRAAIINLQRRSRVFEVGEEHYNLGNEFYEGMLDRRMIYSCAYWENAHTLDEAQEAKLALGSASWACGPWSDCSTSVAAGAAR